MSVWSRMLKAVAGVGTAALLAGCWEAPPVETQQIGFRGVAMEQVNNPRTQAALRARNQAPEPDPPADAGGQRAREAYQNVQVLGDLSEGEFLRVMAHMTQSVAPEEQGCAYCHNLENLADGSKYQYQVARRMLQMTRAINTTWTPHVGQTGVSCYTCHRGNAIPQYTWFTDPGPPMPNMIGNRMGQNLPLPVVNRSSLPYDSFTPLLQYAENIRVITPQALPTGTPGASLQETERTYALMIHMSQGLGVNCTFCHNSRSFGSWDSSPITRTTAWHGIRMVRDLNNTYLAPLNATYPANRLGPTGDAAKAFCTTCHQGQNKPLNGAPMLQNYPELGAPRQRPQASTAAPRG